jgi:5-methylcytosine-specific restriction protein A
LDEQRRPRSSRRYGPTFERNRKILLSSKPLCACGCGWLADTADHYPLTRRELVARGAPDPDALPRLRPMHHACHAKKSGGERSRVSTGGHLEPDEPPVYRYGSPSLR